jgi:DNA-binding response OmpR family regulator
MSKRTILLMDFDPAGTTNTLRALTEAGFDVVTTHDGLEGLRAFRQVQPDLVIIEPMLPGQSGFEVCREIKQSTGGNEVPVVLASAYYRVEEFRDRARAEYLCDEFLEKPVPPAALVVLCDDLLRSYEEREPSVEAVAAMFADETEKTAAIAFAPPQQDSMPWEVTVLSIVLGRPWLTLLRRSLGTLLSFPL